MRKIVTTIFAVLFLILTAQVLVSINVDTLYMRKQPTKGLLIDVNMLGSRNIPSFRDLYWARFVLVGTPVTPQFDQSGWSKIAAWIQSAHNAGLRTFVMVGAGLVPDLNTAAQWTGRAASIGADIVELDELIARLNASETSLRSIIEAGLAVNPNLQFIITEYDSYSLQVAYSWTSQYSSVRVADDDYDNKTRIDVNIQLGLSYGKRAYTWLVFNGVSTPFDCYVHLDDWITYVKQRDTDVLFYWINGNSAWAAQWPEVQSF